MHNRPRIHYFLLGLLLVLPLIGTPPPVQAQTNTLFRVYLTFEDGPTGTYTPELLDILAAYDAKATFFVNGYQIAGREHVLQRIIRAGEPFVGRERPLCRVSC